MQFKVSPALRLGVLRHPRSQLCRSSEFLKLKAFREMELNSASIENFICSKMAMKRNRQRNEDVWERRKAEMKMPPRHSFDQVEVLQCETRRSFLFSALAFVFLAACSCLGLLLPCKSSKLLFLISHNTCWRGFQST